MIAQAKTHIRRLLPRNAFARGVSVLVGGTAGAQVLMVPAAPVLTRLYSPEDFGCRHCSVGGVALPLELQIFTMTEGG
jgi:hypothetical protein